MSPTTASTIASTRCTLPSILGLALFLLPSCAESRESEAATGSKLAQGIENEPPSPPSASSIIRFTDVTAASNLTLENVSGDPIQKLAIPENIGQGAAVLDFDRDGRLDVFIANGDVLPGTPRRASPRCALYRNEGELRFRDVTEEAGLVFDGWVHGAWAVDFDGDGWTDLYLTCFLGPNIFFRNRGDGTFEDATLEWGGADPGPSTAAAFFDADNDGDLDLYVGNYVHYDPAAPPNGGNPCSWKGLTVSCGPLGTPPAADTFWENLDGKLSLATKEFGFDTPSPSYALGCITGDFDNDGDVDLYVANDSRPNFLFENMGNKKFREVAIHFGVDMNEEGRAQAGMGLECADFDNDGRFDLFVTNFSHDTNTLYHNQKTTSGRTLFADATFAMRLGEASYQFLSWGTRGIDLDRDGWQDIIIVSGHVYPQVDGAELGTGYAQRNQIFRNLGPVGPKGRIQFEEMIPSAGDGFLKEAVSRGLVAADFDEDGDLDLLIVEMDAKPTLLRNDTQSPGNWIGFSLIGSGRNRDAIGSRLEIEDRNGRKQYRERTFGAGFLSTSDPRLMVGLGTIDGPVRSVRVTWPSGKTEIHENLAPNRYWAFDEMSTVSPPPK